MSDHSIDKIPDTSGEPPGRDNQTVVIPEAPSMDIGAQPLSAPGLPAMSMGGGPTPAALTALDSPALDGYTVISAIGQGGMGTVWRAMQLSTRRDVALKLMSAAGFASERARQRFDREVEITARLEHPNIARIYDSGLNRGVYFYAMELIDGLPLDQYVASRHLSRQDTLQLFMAICGAVHHAHGRGVIHRDLKPANILVTSDGQPHVLDFGLAKGLLDAGKEAGISLDGEVAGTPGFMSPEQASGKPDIDARTDVYALGVILYRLLTGQSPHDLTGTYLDVLRRVSEEQPKRPRLADRTLNRELEAILLRALQRNAIDRYKTAGELSRDIESYLSGDPIAAKAPTTIYYLRKRVRKHRGKLTAFASLLALLILAALLTIKLGRSKRETHTKEQETRNAELRTLEENRNKELSFGNNAVLTGDQALVDQKWREAKSQYQAALIHFKAANASPLRADFGLWDVARLAPEPLASCATTQLLSAAPVFLSDNRRILQGCEDGSLYLSDLATGQTLKVLEAHHGPIRSIALSSDDSLALTGADGGELKLWDLHTGQLKARLNNPSLPLKNRVTHVAFSPDGRFALSASGASSESVGTASYNDTLTLWEIKTARPLLVSTVATPTLAGLFDVKGTATQIAFSPDSTMILAAAAEVVVWNASDGKRLVTLPHSGTAACFLANGKWLAAGSSDGAVRLLELSTQRSVFLAHTGNAVSSLGFDATRNLILIGTEDGAFRATDMEGNERFTQPSRGEINFMATSPDGRIGLTTTDGELNAWRLDQPGEAREFDKNGPFPHAILSRDGRLALSRSANHVPSREKVVLWDTETGHRLTPAGFPTGPCNGIALSRDGRKIARIAGPALSVWSLDPPHEARRWEIKPARALADAVSVALSGDGSKVALCEADHSIMLYTVMSDSAPLKLIGHAAPATGVCFSADSRTILSGSEDQTAQVWNADTGKTVAVLRGHEAPVNAVDISDDGKIAVTASGAAPFQTGNDNSIRVWQLPGGQLLNTFAAQNKRVRSVAISGDGSLVASGSDDKSVTLWDVTTGVALRTIIRPHGPAQALSFDASGTILLCGADTLSAWNFTRPLKQQEIESSIAAAKLTLQSRPNDPVSLTALGHGYAWEGEPAWALGFFNQPQSAHSPVKAMDLVRCHWDHGDFNDAAQLIKSGAAGERPNFYIKLCEQAILAEGRNAGRKDRMK